MLQSLEQLYEKALNDIRGEKGVITINITINIDGFYREIYNSLAKLYAKYLIFGYSPTTHGFKVENIYLKNLWEITGKGSVKFIFLHSLKLKNTQLGYRLNKGDRLQYAQYRFINPVTRHLGT
ncbi:MAG: hypothetical protein FWF79_00890 [Defluviitaleaceae bacterium]|nr:hypothetical protein [Defluviitaleaceae bacterium]